MYYVVCAKIIDFKTVDFIDSGEKLVAGLFSGFGYAPKVAYFTEITSKMTTYRVLISIICYSWAMICS